MDGLFGAEGSLIVRFVVAFVIVLALIGATFWVIRRFGGTREGRARGLGRRPFVVGRRRAIRDGAHRPAFRGSGPRHRHISRRRHRDGADDILFHHDVAWAADHQQMLDIVAPHQHEAAASIDRGGVDHG